MCCSSRGQLPLQLLAKALNSRLTLLHKGLISIRRSQTQQKLKGWTLICDVLVECQCNVSELTSLMQAF